jgi:hypothetical protein
MHLVLFSLIVLAAPLSVQAQTCFWYSCDYIVDGNMETASSWDVTGTIWETVPSCLYGSPNTTVAALQNTEAVSQDLYVDGSATTWELEFNAFLVDDTENWYDQLKVTVKNLDTNQTETLYLHGNNYDTSCDKVVMTLNNDYSDANVRVKFETAYLATGTYQIDNVSLWGHNFP